MLSDQSIRLSVNDQNPPDMTGFGGAYWWGNPYRSNDIIGEWGNPAAEFQLRRAFYHLHNTMAVGNLTSIMRRFTQTSWELSGGKNKTRTFQNVFQESQYGAGYDKFIKPVLQDALTLDSGGWIEIVGKGASDTPLKGEVVGLNALDGLRCYPTGNPEFPVWFRSHWTGELHKMHYSRVERVSDNPSPDPEMRGLGLSAMRRAIAVCTAQIQMSKYNIEKLSDLPPTGIVTFSGINKMQLQDAMHGYEAGRVSDGQTVWRNLMTLTSLDPSQAIKVEITPFSQLPDNFDYFRFMETHALLLALAIGDDPQEIWPLSGQGLNGGEQSRVLAEQGKAKLLGDLLSQIERIINIAILPKDLEFKFKPKDTEQDKVAAENAKAWSDIAVNLTSQGLLTTKTAVELLANVIPEYRDVMIDASGNIRVPDSDVAAPGQENFDPQAVNTTPVEGETVAEDETPLEGQEQRAKEITNTKEDFTRDWLDLINRARNGDMDRRRFGTVARALITRFGRAAYRDGLAVGGVSPDDITDSDLSRINELVMEQSGYVTDFGALLFRGDGISVAQADVRPELWFNKSIMPFYNAGVQSADINGMYKFGGDDGQESCSDCMRLKGQVHRMSAWVQRDKVPPNKAFECGGWQCKHRLEKTSERARGGW